jgi:hypothetical protein
MPALTPRATPRREGDSALVRVLEASIETLKAENEILMRCLAVAEARGGARDRKGGRGHRRAFGHHAAPGAGGPPLAMAARGISPAWASPRAFQEPGLAADS